MPCNPSFTVSRAVLHSAWPSSLEIPNLTLSWEHNTMEKSLRSKYVNCSTWLGSKAKGAQTSSTELKTESSGLKGACQFKTSRMASWEEEQLLALWAGKLTAGHLQQYYSRPCSNLFSVKLSSLYAILFLNIWTYFTEITPSV